MVSLLAHEHRAPGETLVAGHGPSDQANHGGAIPERLSAGLSPTVPLRPKKGSPHVQAHSHSRFTVAFRKTRRSWRSVFRASRRPDEYDGSRRGGSPSGRRRATRHISERSSTSSDGPVVLVGPFIQRVVRNHRRRRRRTRVGRPGCTWPASCPDGRASRSPTCRRAIRRSRWATSYRQTAVARWRCRAVGSTRSASTTIFCADVPSARRRTFSMAHAQRPASWPRPFRGSRPPRRPGAPKPLLGRVSARATSRSLPKLHRFSYEARPGSHGHGGRRRLPLRDGCRSQNVRRRRHSRGLFQASAAKLAA